MQDIPIDRRTALKMTGVGLAGSALFPGNAAAGKGFDASVILLDTFIEGVEIEHFRNVTTDPDTDFSLKTDGAVMFEKNGSGALGGGPFTLRDDGDVIVEDGFWKAQSVETFERYGFFPSSHPAPFPKEWKGGLVELEVEFDPSIQGVDADDLLTVECWIGTNDSDNPQKPSQGVFVGDYTKVEAFGTIFTY